MQQYLVHSTSNVCLSNIYQGTQRVSGERDSDRVAFSLVGCDYVALAAGGLSFVCPTAATSNTACNLENRWQIQSWKACSTTFQGSQQQSGFDPQVRHLQHSVLKQMYIPRLNLGRFQGSTSLQRLASSCIDMTILILKQIHCLRSKIRIGYSQLNEFSIYYSVYSVSTPYLLN